MWDGTPRILVHVYIMKYDFNRYQSSALFVLDTVYLIILLYMCDSLCCSLQPEAVGDFRNCLHIARLVP